MRWGANDQQVSKSTNKNNNNISASRGKAELSTGKHIGWLIVTAASLRKAVTLALWQSLQYFLCKECHKDLF